MTSVANHSNYINANAAGVASSNRKQLYTSLLSFTSQINILEGNAPQNAFALEDVKGVGVVHKSAEGKKCARSWRILSEVGSDPEFPELSLRDAAAIREIDATN